jgi:outer membrane protein TolC
MRFLKSSLELDYNASRIAMTNGISTLKLRKQSQDLALEVYTTARAKYDQGVGSSIELLQAESALNEAQNNYFNALQDLLMSKVDFDKASGKLTK